MTVFAGDTGFEKITIGTGTAENANATGTQSLNVNAILGSSALSISGNNGNNTITGTFFNDTILGAAGNDTLIGAGGNDKLNGGEGSDSYIFTSASHHTIAEITDNGVTGNDEIIYKSGVVGETLTLFSGDIGIESITIGGNTAVVDGLHSNNLNIDASALNNAVRITGNLTGNTLIGTINNDTLFGDEGSDTLIGGSGVDVLDGGQGSDIYIISTSSQHTFAEISDSGIDLGDGIDDLRFTSTIANETLTVFAGEIGLEKITIGTGTGSFADSSGTTSLNINAANAANALFITGNNGINTIAGTSFSDTINAGSGSDTVNGGNGNDTITAGDGDDSILGGLGNDVIAGGLGNDVLNGGDGSDIYLLNLANSTSTEHTVAEFFDDGVSGIDEIRFATTAASSTLVLYAGDVGIEKVVIGTGSAVNADTTGVQSLNVDASAITNGLNITGNSGNNQLTGTAFNDTLDGGEGNDILLGNAGNDSLAGGNGNDTLDGDIGSDTLNGGEGSDTYYIKTSAEHPIAEINDMGSSGIDQLLYGSGALAPETLTLFAGDIGLEKIIVSSTHVISLNVNASAVANALNIAGDVYSNVLTGTAYNDTLRGGGGTDTLNGGNGNDLLIGDTSQGQMNGGAGNDIIVSSGYATLMNGGNDGDLYLLGGYITENISDDGTIGIDEVRFNSTVQGSTLTLSQEHIGIENVVIGAGMDAIADISGTLNLNVAVASVLSKLKIVGNNGNNYLTATQFNDTVNGGAGNDTIDGLSGNDLLDGGENGDLYLISSAGQHSVAEIQDSGMQGLDEVRFTSGLSSATLTLFAGDTGLERVVIGTGNLATANSTAATSLNIDASAVLNGLTIIGNAGDNNILGTVGFDVINGGTGIDTMDGAENNDVYIISKGSDHITSEINDTGIDLDYLYNPLIDQVRFSSTLTGDTLNLYSGDTGIEMVVIGTSLNTNENLILGYDRYGSIVINAGTGSSSDTSGVTALNVNASAVSNGLILIGNSGNNIITGTSYNDHISGGAGVDVLNGGVGNDVYYFFSSNDHTSAEITDTGDYNTVRFASTTADQTLTLFAGDTGISEILIAEGEYPAYFYSTNLNVNASAVLNGLYIQGNYGDNIITGTDFNDRIDAGGGNNVLYGGAGDDELYGDYGKDFIHGGIGNDNINGGFFGLDELFGDDGNDTLIGSYDSNIIDGGNGNDLVVGGSGNDLLTGGSGDDTIYGDNGSSSGDGQDTLIGGAGNDFLIGQGQNDVLTGGAGTDIFAFQDGYLGIDTITDFTIGEDMIEWIQYGLSLQTGVVSANSFVKGINPQALDANDYFIYNTNTGALYYDVDGNGAQQAVQFATLTGHPDISSNDLIVV